MSLRDRIVELRRVPASTLKAHPENWRDHSDAQRRALQGVLEKIGFIDVVLARVDEAGELELFDGHLRREIMGDEEVPVLITDLTREEARFMLTALDPLAAMAGTNSQALAGLLADIADQIPDDLLKALQRQALPIKATEVVTPEKPAQPVAQLGDLWKLGDHRLLCADSTDPDNLQRVMGGHQAALVWTDPPYGVGYEGGATLRPALVGDEDTALYATVLPLLTAHVRPTAALYLWHPCRDAEDVYRTVNASGWRVRSQIIWVKNLAQFGAFGAQYHQKHDPCLYCHRRGKTPAWYGPTNEVSVWEVDRAAVNEFHPTQKPVALAVRSMANSSKRGDYVVDPFCGGGTTLLAAEQLGRRARCIEKDPGYVDVAIARWENLSGGKAIKV